MPSPASASAHQFCLKWNNHSSNFSGTFSRLRDASLFTDVTLAARDGETVKAHRIVLSASSAYLEGLLASVPASEHPAVVLPTVTGPELHDLLSFMYSGEVAVEQERLQGLLEAATALGVRGLCEDNHASTSSPAPSSSTSSPGKRRRESVRSSLDSFLSAQQQQDSSPYPSEEPSIPSPGSKRGGSSTVLDEEEKKAAAADLLQLVMGNIMGNGVEGSPAAKKKRTTAPIGIEAGMVGVVKPARRYKNYSDAELSAALEAIKSGTSINQSSHRFGIPARTLRDRMKALNITSRFTVSGGGGTPRPAPGKENENALHSNPDPIPLSVAFPGMVTAVQDDDDEEEEEIDDDEEHSLLVVNKAEEEAVKQNEH